MFDAYESIPPLHQQPSEDMDDSRVGNTHCAEHLLPSTRGVFSQAFFY
jgi:hypothetical protein